MSLANCDFMDTSFAYGHRIIHVVFSSESAKSTNDMSFGHFRIFVRRTFYLSWPHYSLSLNGGPLMPLVLTTTLLTNEFHDSSCITKEWQGRHRETPLSKIPFQCRKPEFSMGYAILNLTLGAKLFLHHRAIFKTHFKTLEEGWKKHWKSCGTIDFYFV